MNSIKHSVFHYEYNDLSMDELIRQIDKNSGIHRYKKEYLLRDESSCKIKLRPMKETRIPIDSFKPYLTIEITKDVKGLDLEVRCCREITTAIFILSVTVMLMLAMFIPIVLGKEVNIPQLFEAIIVAGIAYLSSARRSIKKILPRRKT